MGKFNRAGCCLALALLTAGCGGQETETFVIPEGRVTVAAEPESVAVATPDAPVITADSDSVVVQDADGAATVGHSTELPENTPEDLPRYPGMTIHSVTVSQEPMNIVYQAEVTVGTVGAIGWFSSETERLGWKRKDGMTQPEFAYANYEKDGRTMSVNINSGDPQTGTGTILTVVYAE